LRGKLRVKFAHEICGNEFVARSLRDVRRAGKLALPMIARRYAKSNVFPEPI
jgi:hypothetical protein